MEEKSCASKTERGKDFSKMIELKIIGGRLAEGPAQRCYINSVGEEKILEVWG